MHLYTLTHSNAHANTLKCSRIRPHGIYSACAPCLKVSSNAPEAVEDRLSLLVEAIVTPAPVEEQEEGGEGGADHLEAHATPATTSGAAENGEENLADPVTSTFITGEAQHQLHCCFDF